MTSTIPIVHFPAPNSWLRTNLPNFPQRCPICGSELDEVWQDHHLATPYQAGWLTNSWMCKANVDGQDCSRFVFVHRLQHVDGIGIVAEPCEVVFNCQKTRSLGVEEICRQVLMARGALENKSVNQMIGPLEIDSSCNIPEINKALELAFEEGRKPTAIKMSSDTRDYLTAQISQSTRIWLSGETQLRIIGDRKITAYISKWAGDCLDIRLDDAVPFKKAFLDFQDEDLSGAVESRDDKLLRAGSLKK